MDMYKCRFVNQSGNRRKMTIQADSEAHAYELLQSQGYYPIALNKESPLEGYIRKRFRKLPEDETILFAKQVAFSLRSGFSLLETLHHIKNETSKTTFLRFVQQAEQNLLQGMSFSDAIHKTPYAVPQLLIDWAVIGERQGKLDTALDDAAKLLDESRRFKDNLRAQLAYPLLILVLILAVTALVLIIVLPVLAETYFGMYQTLPWYLSLMLYFGKLLPWLLGWLLLFLLIAALIKKRMQTFVKHPKMTMLRKQMLKMPVLRDVLRWSTFVPFARVFGQLLASGVSAGDALGMLEKQPSFRFFQHDIAAVNRQLITGQPLSLALQRCSFIPQMAAAMIAMGERSGQLPRVLLESSKHYEERLMSRISFLVKMIEPLTIVLLGIIVLMVALGLFLPLLDSYQVFMR